MLDKNTIWVMALEPIETRYTCQWYEGIPELLKKEAEDRGVTVDVMNVRGNLSSVSMTPSEGAFLDFVGTNIWKNEQMNMLARDFSLGRVQAGDKILFTDAWHPGIIQTKYMSELLDVPVEIHAIWHAGSYDPQDFLGRKIKDKRWSLNFERSLYETIDYNYFATQFHIDLFLDNVLDAKQSIRNCVVKGPAILFAYDQKKIVRSGQPHNKLIEQLDKYRGTKKRDLILFPHRLAPEKQPEIFRDLAKSMPEYEWVICADQKLSKDEYNKLLAESKIVFSANLQETLGIGAMEAILVDSIPLVPNRLSYSEMYDESFKYTSEMTSNFENYLKYKGDLLYLIKETIENYSTWKSKIAKQRERLLEDYLYPGAMLNRLLGKKHDNRDGTK